MSGSPVRQPTLNMPLDTTPNGGIPNDVISIPSVTSTRHPGVIAGGSQDKVVPNPKD